MRLAWSKGWIVSAGAALLVIALLVALRTPRVGVDVAVVESGPMSVLVEEEGRTRVKQVYSVSAPITGRVLRTILDVGDAVVKDQTVVAVIQPSDPPFLDMRARLEVEAQIKAAIAAVELAEAELRQAEGELEFAEAELVRNRRLAESGTVPSRTLQKAELEAVTHRAAVGRAKAQIELRRRQLDSERAKLVGPERQAAPVQPADGCCVNVKAPASGRILKRLHESEKIVVAGTPLLEIGDTADMEIVADLLSTDAVKIKPGAAVSVSGWGGGRILDARVRRIEPGGFTKVSALGIDEQRVTVVIDFKSGDIAALGHDYRVYVAITSWEADNLLRVPISALFRHGKDWAVYMAKGGRAVRTIVEIGQRNPDVAEVRRGLAAKDRVILHPSDRITDGTRITERLAPP